MAPLSGRPAVARADTAKPSTEVVTRTVAVGPPMKHPSNRAAFPAATVAAIGHGLPERMPTATSAAASADASAAPATRCCAESTVATGTTRQNSMSTAAMIATARMDPEPLSLANALRIAAHLPPSNAQLVALTVNPPISPATVEP